MSTTLRRNILANYLGKAWLAVMSLAFIPLYIRLMGVEAYGLVGFYVSLMAVLSFMELGMGTTLNRELARLVGRGGEGADTARDLLRSFEWLIWGGSLGLAVVVWSAAPWIGAHWLRAEGVDAATIARAIALMGLAIAMRLPFQVYSGGLCGLQHQGVYNLLLAIGATLRSAGVVLVLFWSPTIEAFFVWHIGVEALTSLFAAIVLWRRMPANDGARPGFRRRVIGRVWQFSLGMTLIGILGALLAQLDRFMVGRLLSLEMLGYYAVAVALASALYYLAYPINTAMFPRYSELLARGETAGLIAVYRRSARLMAAVTWPTVALLVCYPGPLIMAWTGDAVIAEQVAVVLPLLAIGVGLNAVALLPGSLIQASGRIRPSLFAYGGGLLFLIPWLSFALPHWGLTGAASGIVIYNLWLCIVNFTVLCRFIDDASVFWEGLHGNLLLMLMAFSFMVVTRFLIPPIENRLGQAIVLGVLFSVSISMAMMIVRPGIRCRLPGWGGRTLVP